jgi:hypothetical protein
MKANVGTTEKVIRIILGIVIIGAGVVYQSWWGAVGAIPLVTALVGYCPAWSIFGVNTCKTAEN